MMKLKLTTFAVVNLPQIELDFIHFSILGLLTSNNSIIQTHSIAKSFA